MLSLLILSHQPNQLYIVHMRKKIKVEINDMIAWHVEPITPDELENKKLAEILGNITQRLNQTIRQQNKIIAILESQSHDNKE